MPSVWRLPHQHSQEAQDGSFHTVVKNVGTFRVSSEIQVITPRAFYPDWTYALSAIMIAKEISSTKMLPSEDNPDRKPLADSTANSIKQGGR
jgi:hypothetical protein